MTNMLSVKNTIHNVQRETLKNQADSWHTLILRVHLADVYLQLEAVNSAMKELEAVKAALDEGKYKTVPYGYFIVACNFGKFLSAMDCCRLKFRPQIQQLAGKMEEYIKETGFDRAGMLKTQYLQAKCIEDPSCI